MTHNEQDFLLLHRAWRRWRLDRPHHGILDARQSVLRLPTDIGRVITNFLDSGLHTENELYVLHRDRQWYRYPVERVISDTLSL